LAEFCPKGERKQIIVRKRVVLSFVLISFAVFLYVPEMAAQQPRVPQEEVLRALIRLEQKVSPEQRKFFSGAVSNWLSFAHSILKPQNAGPDDSGGPPPTLAATRASSQHALGTPSAFPDHAESDEVGSDSFEREERNRDVERVSNPSLDLRLSRLAGFTQSTSSSAWCGHNVVTGFNSSTAGLTTATLPFEQNPNLVAVSQSSVGVAFSTNDGETFIDLGFLNPGPTTNTTTGLNGNPVLACTSSEKFFYISSPFVTLINDPVTFQGQVFFGVGLSISSDGGRHWANPTAVVSKDANNLVDRAWLAVDPSNHRRFYVTYTDLDLDGVFGDTVQSARCPNTVRHAIELVTSGDGGRTWSSPSVVREDCDPLDAHGFPGPGNTSTGSQIAVGADGRVFISYMVFEPNGSIQLNFRQSADHAASFSPEVMVSQVIPTGDPAGLFEGFLQGFFRNRQVPTMAVDNSKHRGNGAIYIAWSDGRDNPQVDVVAPTGMYNFSDILLTKSTDGGATWSVPRPVSPTPEDFAGPGRDQFQPALAVDRAGVLAVCYYDRRNDPQNNAVDHYCSVSGDQGHSFDDIRQTNRSWIPAHGADLFTDSGYLGDYDTLAPHLAADDGGFFSSFQIIENDTPSVHGRSFRREE
jgi:hypothetical protein